jgi:hypothetical protein
MRVLLLLTALSFLQVAGAFFTAAPTKTLTGDKLISITKEYIEKKNGFYGPMDRDSHAEDFVFRGGAVGPLNKDDYCDTIEKLNIYDCFNLQPNCFGFCIDPDDAFTVRFFVRYTGKQVKPWTIKNTPLNFPIVSKPVQGATESYAVKLNGQGQIRFLSAGNTIPYGNPYVTSTEKKGAVFGLLSHVGAGLSLGSANNRQVRSSSDYVSRLMGKFGPPVTASLPEELPSWWNEL